MLTKSHLVAAGVPHSLFETARAAGIGGGVLLKLLLQFGMPAVIAIIQQLLASKGQPVVAMASGEPALMSLEDLAAHGVSEDFQQQVVAAGFDWGTVLSLFLQFGVPLVQQIVQAILDALKSKA